MGTETRPRSEPLPPGLTATVCYIHPMKRREARGQARKLRKRLESPEPLSSLGGHRHGERLPSRAYAQDLMHYPGFQGAWAIVPDPEQGGLFLKARSFMTPEELARADIWERENRTPSPEPYFSDLHM